MLLDPRTAVLLAMLIAATLAAFIGLSIARYPDPLRRQLAHWARALGLQAAGWCLFGLRGQISDFWTVLVANTLLVLAFVMALRALRGFAGRREAHGSDVAVVVAVIAIGSIFLYVSNSLPVRIALISLLYALLFAQSAWMALQAAPPPRPASHWVVAGLYLLLALLLTARALTETFGVQRSTDALAITPFQSVLFAVGALAPLLATFGFFLMVSERLRGELTRHATLDALTGAFNRRTLAELAGQAIAQSRRHGGGLALLLLDVDRFKRVNDSLGHAAGDEALQALVDVLREAKRSEDLLGRMGGEEFIVLLPGADLAHAIAAAERLREAVEHSRLVLHGREWPMTVSIGAAALEAGDDFSSMLRRADAAMYAAKHAGRNRVMAAPAAGAGPGVMQ
jgi:diguanylate cyclase (GGDEF)-like protein